MELDRVVGLKCITCSVGVDGLKRVYEMECTVVVDGEKGVY